MRAPTFPLDREKTYSTHRGITLFYNSNWSLRYNWSGKRVVESLGTQDDKLAYKELLAATDALVKGQSPREIVGARHHTTATVAEAAKEFLTSYTTISLGSQGKQRAVLQGWVIGQNFDAATQIWTPRDDAQVARPFGALETHIVETRDVRALLKRVRSAVNQYGRPNSRAYAKVVLDSVRLLFNWLIAEGKLKDKHGHVLVNPAARCGKFTFDAQQDSQREAGEDEDVKVFEPGQQQALLDWFYLHCRRLYAMVLTGFCAGLRYGEVVALEISDYDPVRHTLRVTKHWTPEGLMRGTKSNRIAHGVIRTRTVPTHLDPRLEPALDAHIAWLREMRPAGWDGTRLFPAKPFRRAEVGAYIRPSNFYRLWDPACQVLGIKGLTFQNCRHTFATACLHAGATPQEVAGWLGDTLEVTLRHYAHTIKGLQRDRAGLLAGGGRVNDDVHAGRPTLHVVQGGAPNGT